MQALCGPGGSASLGVDAQEHVARLMSFVFGCADVGGTGAEDYFGADDDDLADDDGEPSVVFEVDWQLSAVIPTVVTVDWSVDSSSVDEAWIEFGPADTYAFSAPAIDDGDGGYESVLLGLKPSPEASFRAAVTVESQTTRSEPISFVTGPIPQEIPGPHLGTESRAVEYTIDLETGLAELVWEHVSDPPLYVYSLGDLARLPSGNTLVVWSTSGLMEEVTPAGEVVLQVGLPLGVGFGYTRWMETLYYGD